MSAQHSNEGTMSSYVIGFILSLPFTVIPYYLVVHQTVTGNKLLGVILCFAAVQLFVQITFFLHLGRGPKPNWNLFFFGSTVLVVMLVVGGSILIIGDLNYNMTPTQQAASVISGEGIAQLNGISTGGCSEPLTNHQIIIKNGQPTPLHPTVTKCDTVTFVNQDSQKRIIAFGVSPADGVYAGQKDLAITKGYNQTITMSVTGTFVYYDRLHPQTVGSFTVSL